MIKRSIHNLNQETFTYSFPLESAFVFSTFSFRLDEDLP